MMKPPCPRPLIHLLVTLLLTDSDENIVEVRKLVSHCDLGPHHLCNYTLYVDHFIMQYYPNAKFIFCYWWLTVIYDIWPLLFTSCCRICETTYCGCPTPKHHPPIIFPPVHMGNALILPSATVTVDTNMTMETQIISVVRQSFLSFRDMLKVRLSQHMNGGGDDTDISSPISHYFVASSPTSHFFGPYLPSPFFWTLISHLPFVLTPISHLPFI